MVEESKEQGQSSGKDKRRWALDRERGVYVSHSANKQKVNTSGGNSVTHDAADRSSTCSLRFLRRPFYRPQDNSSTKTNTSFPFRAPRDKRGKKVIQYLCLLRLKHVSIYASCPILSALLPPSLPGGNSTGRDVELSVNSLSTSS